MTDPLSEVKRLLAPCPACDLGGGEEANCTCSELLPVGYAQWLLAEVQVLRDQLGEAGLLLWNLPQIDDHDWAMRARRLSARINDTLISGPVPPLEDDPGWKALPMLERQRTALAKLEEAREEWKRQAGHWSAIRAQAVQELKQGRTWAQVAGLLGVSEATAWNIAHPKKT